MYKCTIYLLVHLLSILFIMPAQGCYNIKYHNNNDVKEDPPASISDSRYSFLGRTVNPNAYKYDLTEDNTWGVTFSFGKITGIASCNKTRGRYLETSTKEFSQQNAGQYCWCKMTTPVKSHWLFFEDEGTDDLCFTLCANHCERIKIPGVFSEILDSLVDESGERWRSKIIQQYGLPEGPCDDDSWKKGTKVKPW